MKVGLPGRAYLGDIERFLSTIEENNSKDLLFQPKEGLFSLHPLVLTILSALADDFRANGREVHLGQLEANSSTRYLQRMGLFDTMGTEANLPVTEHDPSGRFIPLTRINNNDDLNRFVTDFVPLLHADPDVADTVKYVLFELIRNVLEHAGASDRGALAAAQVTKSGRLLIGVADSGIGIKKSLSRSHPTSTHRSAIELAFQPGITGTTAIYGGNETNGGAGLFFMKAMSTLSRNHMVALSGNSLMKLLKQRLRENEPLQINRKLSEDRVRWKELDIEFPGTAVGVDITIEDSMAFGDLLRSIREVYHLNVKKSKRAQKRARFI